MFDATDPDPDTEPSSRPEVLAAQLLEARAIYQDSLVEAAQARRRYDSDLATAQAALQASAHRFQPDLKLLALYEEQWLAYGQSSGVPAPERDRRRPISDPAHAWSSAAAQCQADLDRYAVIRRSWEGKRRILGLPAEPRLPISFGDDLAILQAIAKEIGRSPELESQDVLTQRIATLRSDFENDAIERERRVAQQMESRVAALRMGVELLGVRGQPWSQLLAEPVLSEGLVAATRLGYIESGLPRAYDVELPCVVSFPAARSLAIQASLDARESALSLLRSVVLRVLMDAPPGRLQLSLIDPTGLGQTFADFTHLGDHDDRLINTSIKTTAAAIERCLEENVAHIETVISKYLRGQFENIHSYNVHAGEVAEPYRLIAIADYPRQFTERACEQLLSLVENGPRCGVFVVLLYSPDEEAPRSLPHARLTQSMDLVAMRGHNAELRLASGGQAIEFTCDRCPDIGFDVNGQPTTGAAQVLESLGRAAKRTGDSIITLAQFLPMINRNRAGAIPEFQPGAPPVSEAPDTWWHATTCDMAVAPIGRSGAQGVASMFFSSTTVAGGAIMVGLPRSGKTTSLHAMILTMTMLYSPDELELYLIDAKHGVEFKAYETLPHARMVSIHSEREFSLAVLKSLQAKIRERAELFKAQGAGLSNLTEYRTRTGDSLPRIVVVIDEFHELFEEVDNIGQEAFAAFSDIVRMGPFSGVHVVVASQTLSSMPAMDRQTLTLLPQRVAFMCNEYDAEIVMGDTNKATRLLTETGEGLFNPSRGDESRNQPFRGLYVTPDQRALLLREMRDKADAEGWLRHPRVFDGDAVVDRPSQTGPVAPSGRFSIAVGEPLTLADSESIIFSRGRGSNMLLVGDRDDDSSPDLALRGVVHSVLLAAQEQGAQATVIDFLGDEDSHGTMQVMDVAHLTGASYGRARTLETTLADFTAEISARTESGNYRAPTRLLVLFGLQRALNLTPYDPYSYPDDGSPSVSRMLAEAIAAGPEVGVHVVIHADQTRSLELRLGADLLNEVTIRVSGSGGDQRDVGLVAGGYGTIAPVRYGQLLIGDQMRGSTKRIRGYRPLAAVSEAHAGGPQP